MGDLALVNRAERETAMIAAQAAEEAAVAAPRAGGRPSCWSDKYGERHRMTRIDRWPAGIRPPVKVRVYFRSGRFLLQWWEPSEQKNVAERVEGDLIAAVARAREVDAALLARRSSGRGASRLRHAELVRRFLQDLGRRADAGEVEPRTVVRYRSALAHYLAFAGQPAHDRRWPWAGGVDRTFALAFAAFLQNRSVSPNGAASSPARPMRGQAFVWDAVRAVYLWAADSDRGGLLADAFRNPFLRRAGGAVARPTAADPFGEPDVTMSMARDLLQAADEYQLRLFAPLLFYGLRASEPAYLFHEYVENDWLTVPCNPDLGYTTKGKRSKRLPLFEPLATLLRGPAVTGTVTSAARSLTHALTSRSGEGLLYLRREVAEGAERPELLDAPLGWGGQGAPRSRICGTCSAPHYPTPESRTLTASS